uniref:class I SAM-dependent methyltransferase n=1 Tax=Thaumasiovibrio occultus TaxID=1891184 RepID=UPI000B34F8BA|nr:class I SAM-dependent methyltransferase [Thaumasiovibrio occultus]
MATEQYNPQVSAHYAAYRPPVHQLILASLAAKSPVSSNAAQFSAGLDIGCGTGVSSVALAAHCDHVLAVDPSEAMIANAALHPSISYHIGDGEAVPVASGSVDVVTLAGSLFYAKSDALVAELVRVGHAQSVIWVYDFEVRLESAFALLGIAMASSSSDYDHAINLSDSALLTEVECEQSALTLTMTTEQLAHVLFSSSRRFDVFVAHFGADNTFEQVVTKLNAHSTHHSVSVDTYCSVYRLK